MDTRKSMQKTLALLTCVVFVAVSLFSIAYIAHEAQHDCVGEHCQICTHVSGAKNTLKQLSANATRFEGGALAIVLNTTMFLLCTGVFFVISTPVKLRIRMNH